MCLGCAKGNGQDFVGRKIVRLRELISAGKYDVTSTQLAEAMLRKAQLNVRSPRLSDVPTRSLPN
jgi:anti-sigma28 factor (negative regulator of flagellin synthesis)